MCNFYHHFVFCVVTLDILLQITTFVLMLIMMMMVMMIMTMMMMMTMKKTFILMTTKIYNTNNKLKMCTMHNSKAIRDPY